MSPDSEELSAAVLTGVGSNLKKLCHFGSIHTRINELIPARFSNDFILKGIKLILENNNFTFNNVFYNQSKGTAVGTKVAQTYATLVLGSLEEILYKQNRTEKGKEFAKYSYIEDI